MLLTPLSKFPYPQPTDAADIPAHLQSLAVALDGGTVLRFPDAAARDQALNKPAAGMVVWLDKPGQLFLYAAAGWTPVVQGPAYKINAKAGTTASTTYVETLTGSDGDPMAVAFTAPLSGSVLVTVGAYMGGGASAAAFMTVAIRQGTTVTVAASDERAAMALGTGRASAQHQFLVTGLTAGTAYTATPAYRTAAANSTASFEKRFVRVDPAS
ncbi:hypothetical protein ACSNOK_15555 [Streptomyces sp. URMC 126]|uniref:hypothetical protein n=1 Tax=Streptomyces sp. URMC 126 TaxID=3423401 RepID=UPI003F1E2DE9